MMRFRLYIYIDFFCNYVSLMLRYVYMLPILPLISQCERKSCCIKSRTFGGVIQIYQHGRRTIWQDFYEPIIRKSTANCHRRGILIIFHKLKTNSKKNVLFLYFMSYTSLEVLLWFSGILVGMAKMNTEADFTNN